MTHYNICIVNFCCNITRFISTCNKAADEYRIKITQVSPSDNKRVYDSASAIFVARCACMTDVQDAVSAIARYVKSRPHIIPVGYLLDKHDDKYLYIKHKVDLYDGFTLRYVIDFALVSVPETQSIFKDVLKYVDTVPNKLSTILVIGNECGGKTTFVNKLHYSTVLNIRCNPTRDCKYSKYKSNIIICEVPVCKLRSYSVPVNTRCIFVVVDDMAMIDSVLRDINNDTIKKVLIVNVKSMSMNHYTDCIVRPVSGADDNRFIARFYINLHRVSSLSNMMTVIIAMISSS